MNKMRLILFVILFLALVGCSEDEWLGYAFPDKANLLIHREVGKFKTQKECDEAAMSLLKSLNALENGYYECGKNCKSESYYNRECEEMIRGNLYK
jgi:hypothetical protein